MTKDRAIEVLYVYASVNGSGRCTQDEFEEAKKMAIEALSNSEIPNNSDCISRKAAIDVLNVGAELLNRVLDDADIVGVERAKYEWGLGLIESYIYDMKELPSAQPTVHPQRTCVNCGRTVNNGGWYADGGTRCPIEEHYALPKDGYCHLWEKRNVMDDDYPERREE